MMLDPVAYASTPAPGRDCGTCTLCCKVYDVPSVPKPMGRWCQHCLPGRGCGIHETRPEHCRAFHCLWMTGDWLGPEWKPERCKFVLTIDPVNNFLLAQVDPGSPAAWKQSPYYGHFKQWAQAGAGEGRHVLVFLNQNATLVLPDRDVPVGVIGANERLVIRPLGTGGFDVSRVAANLD